MAATVIPVSQARIERLLRQTFGGDTMHGFEPVEWALLVYLCLECGDSSGSVWIFRDATFDALRQQLGFSLVPAAINAAIDSLASRQTFPTTPSLFDTGGEPLINLHQGILGDGWIFSDTNHRAGPRDGEGFAWQVSLGPLLRSLLTRKARP
jgi:hypothetical protein